MPALLTSARPTCPECLSTMMKNGRNRSGSQKWRCQCGHGFTDSDKPRGSEPLGDKPMTPRELEQRWRAAHPEEAKRQGREKYYRRRQRASQSKIPASPKS